MSIAARQAVCDALNFSDDTQRSDLMTPALTSTELIAFLQELLGMRGGVWRHKLTVTAVRSDHPTPDGPNGHEGGNAIDFVETEVGNAPVHLIGDVQACPDARGIGLGGYYQDFAEDFGGYSASTKLFEDNSSSHIHVQTAGY